MNTVSVAGTDTTFRCRDGQTIVEAAEEAGLAIPYSCRRGACSSCAGELTAGTVRLPHDPPVQGPRDNVLLCQAVPDGPVEIRPRRLGRTAPPARRTLTTKVYRVHHPAPRVTVLQLRFPIGRRAPFRPGQYLEVHLPDGSTRPYSLANAPNANDSAELHVRTEPGGRFSEQIASALRPGDLLTVETPFGDTTVDTGDEPLLLLATGTGFAPVRSILLDHAARRSVRPVHLYWGARRADDLYALAALRTWAARHPWLTVRPVLSRPDAGWDGATGHVQDVALAAHPDLSDHTVYACGSPAMTDAARDLLTGRAGLPAARFLSDAFVPV
jgi:NAD(P)H-flavin reductase/ferredoxin